jgi:hypothetical protein
LWLVQTARAEISGSWVGSFTVRSDFGPASILIEAGFLPLSLLKKAAKENQSPP